jgi:pyruvate/2-oxoglutarate dehydrogenase complex dihydrolipoamide acyltransferase (E2) component
MAQIIEMPKLSDTMTVGTLVKWLKNEGDAVKNGTMLAEVETDKATMELECFFDGTLLKILAPSGSQVEIGAPLCAIGKPGEKWELPAGKPAQKADVPGAVKPVAQSAEATTPASTTPSAKESTATAPSSPAHPRVFAFGNLGRTAHPHFPTREETGRRKGNQSVKHYWLGSKRTHCPCGCSRRRKIRPGQGRYGKRW